MSANEYTAGDLVEAVKGESLVRDRIVKRDTYLAIGVTGSTVLFYQNSGYTITVIEKAAPVVVLPTEPGAYKNGGWSGVIVLNNSGRWLDDFGHYLTMAPGTKLTRLEPVPETAKKVLDRVAKAWNGYPWFEFDNNLDAIARDFGVTE